MTTSTFEKNIRYDRATRDYAAYLDDRLIGFFANHHAAEVELDRVAHELLLDYAEHGLVDTVLAACDPPPGFPDDDDGGPDGGGPPRAATAQSMAIDARVLRCHNCDGAHATWRCPEIARRLLAQPATDWQDADLGRELCRMRWRDFPRFVALLRAVGAAGHLAAYAASYVAFVQSYAPTDLTIPQVLAVWGRILTDTSQQVAA